MNGKDAEWVILDRDGTIIVDKKYLSDPNGVELLPSAASGLRKLQALNLRLILVTNQSGIGRGYFTVEDVNAVHAQMIRLLQREGVKLEGIFVCPHGPEEACDCRKPKIGLVNLAASVLSVKLTEAFVIGDKPCDIELGHNIRGTTFLVGNGDEGQPFRAQCEPHFFVKDLLEAAEVIEDTYKRCY